ncbi:MAG: cytochrome c biogenesis protein CcmG/thiol:disulfide interchange protein DsbE [Flavobacteriales bacterium]|jgi:cytochrome c biogenesis protein CcmG/thiol:disulfide interchange protein DsbE
MKRIKLFIPLIIFIALGILFKVSFNVDKSYAPESIQGTPLPEFSLGKLGDSSGRIYTSADVLGEPFLLNVWATWCAPCHVEHPYLVKLAGEGVKIVGVDYQDADHAALAMLEEKGDPFFITLADIDGVFGLDLRITGAPETFVVNQKGQVLLHHVGVINDLVWREKIKPVYDAMLTAK